MLKDLCPHFTDFISKRTADISNKVAAQDPEHIKLTRECITLWNGIMKFLPKKGKKMLFKYEEKENTQSSLLVEIMYWQGLIDGIRISTDSMNPKAENF